MNEQPEGQRRKDNGFSVVRTPLFKKIYATNVFVFHTDVDVRIELFNEKIKRDDQWVYASDGLVILTPQAAKKLYLRLKDVVGQMESDGEIDVPESRMRP